MTSEGQVTIPKDLREELGIKPGDELVFRKDDDGLRVEIVDPFDEAYHKATGETMTEWMSEEDDRAYSNL